MAAPQTSKKLPVRGLILSDRDRDALLAALTEPPAPNAKLVRAAERYRKAKADGTLQSAPAPA